MLQTNYFSSMTNDPWKSSKYGRSQNLPPLDFSENDIVFDKRTFHKEEIDWKTNDVSFDLEPAAADYAGWNKNKMNALFTSQQYYNYSAQYSPSFEEPCSPAFDAGGYNPSYLGDDLGYIQYTTGGSTLQLDHFQSDWSYLLQDEDTSPIPWVSYPTSQGEEDPNSSVNTLKRLHQVAKSLEALVFTEQNLTTTGHYTDGQTTRDIDLELSDISDKLKNKIIEVRDLSIDLRNMYDEMRSPLVTSPDDLESIRKASVDSEEEDLSELESDEELNLLVDTIISEDD